MANNILKTIGAGGVPSYIEIVDVDSNTIEIRSGQTPNEHIYVFKAAVPDLIVCLQEVHNILAQRKR
jgi:hypothetical protein